MSKLVCAIFAIFTTTFPTLAFAVERAGNTKGHVLLISFKEFLPILILLAVIVFAFKRMPKIQMEHLTPKYITRRAMNWVPLGAIYAFLYMGRYNLTVSKGELSNYDMMSNADFGTIFGIGTLVYGVSFLVNGPLTDRYGGRLTILIAAAGVIVANVLLGLVVWEVVRSGGAIGAVGNVANEFAAPIFHFFTSFRGLFGLASGTVQTSKLLPALSILYAVNMYFQSFGAVAIVKVNSPWFHVKERGDFSAIFGILISLGLYFAYDWNGLLLKFWEHQVHLVFFVPSAILAVCFVVGLIMIRDMPSDAGFKNFDTADKTSGQKGPPDPPLKAFAMLVRNPIVMSVAAIEFCTGFIRQGIMQWGPSFGKATDIGEFVNAHWGMLLCAAGILGGMFAGVISDRVFQSRRGPVAAILYGGMILCATLMCFTLGNSIVMWLCLLGSLCVIGVHGMLSGTATQDFGGTRNAGIAVGIVDGFVYLGSSLMGFWYGWRLPDDAASAQWENWHEWPLWMIPPAIVGCIICYAIRKAIPDKALTAQ